MAKTFHGLDGIVDLAALRESRGVTLEHVAAVTKIALRYLQAIEAAEFRKLPGGVYDISYIRQYAREIGFDPSALLDFYRSQVPCEQPADSEQPKGPAWSGVLDLLWPLRHRRAA